MWFKRRDGFARDVTDLARIAELDPGQVQGFTLVLYLHDGEARITTNGCCTRHALADVTNLANDRIPQLVLCSGEE